MEPQAEKVPTIIDGIHKSVATMHDRHIVDEPNVSELYCRPELMLTADVVQRIQGLRLGFGKSRNAGRTRASDYITDKAPPREVDDDPAILVIEQRSVIERRITPESGFDSQLALGYYVTGRHERHLTCRTANLAPPAP